MRQVLLWLLTIVAPWTIGSGTSAETLDSVDQISFEVESTFDFSVPISAFLLEADTVLCGSGAGIFIEAGADRPWQKLIGCVLRSTDWWADCYRREEFHALYSPKCLGQMPGTNQVIVFEEHCNFLLMLPFDSDTSSVAVLWRSDRGGDYLEEVDTPEQCAAVRRVQFWTIIALSFRNLRIRAITGECLRRRRLSSPDSTRSLSDRRHSAPLWTLATARFGSISMATTQSAL